MLGVQDEHLCVYYFFQSMYILCIFVCYLQIEKQIQISKPMFLNMKNLVKNCAWTYQIISR